MSVVISGPLCTPKSSKGRGNCNDSVVAPHVGMVFHRLQEAEEYYRKYAMQQGFGIIKYSSGYNRKKNGKAKKHEVRNATWKCERAGKPRRVATFFCKKKVAEEGDDVVMLPERRGRYSKKVECKALMYVSVDESGSWVVRKVCLEHSGHYLTPVKPLPKIFQHRTSETTNLVKRNLITSLQAGLSNPHVCNSMAVERNGLDQVLVTDRDMRNVVALEKKLKLEEGDANAMMMKRRMAKAGSKGISSPFEPGGSFKLPKPKQKQGNDSHQVLTRGRKRRMIEKGDGSFDSVVPCTPHSQDNMLQPGSSLLLGGVGHKLHGMY